MEIGDIVWILEIQHQNTRYVLCKIIQILHKKAYNMYVCKSNAGYKTTFTDMDLKEEYRNKPKIKVLGADIWK